MSEAILSIMEIIGTVAFAISGALIAARRSLDLFGVILVGCVTSVGGGVLRDVFMGKIPPAIFSNTIILLIAAITSIVVFIILYIHAKQFDVYEKRIETINNFFDAVGLAAFSVTGTEMACAAGFSDKFVFSISMGILTGIGGGIIRDILVDKTPYVLKKHIYALASILGSCLYYFIKINSNKVVAALIAMPFIIIIRVLATKYHWKLPRIRLKY
ncbi:MAG: trimeric intracellular cation channel family protein [Clostridia bacterium]|nr:trimeric intracellular cation channel family protein [Clostridia bacterium]